MVHQTAGISGPSAPAYNGVFGEVIVDDAFRTTGLALEDAARRLLDEGPNELPTSKRRGPFAIIASVVTEPMFLLLLACGALYLVLGDLGEAAMLLGFVFVIIGITFFQERKTERALDALRDLSSPRALVVRGGEDTYASYGRAWANLSNTPFRFYKAWTAEGGIRSPMVIAGAGVKNAGDFSIIQDEFQMPGEAFAW